jgi:hypothetical protein
MPPDSPKWSLRNLFGAKPARNASQAPAPQPFHAISVVPGPRACRAAREVKEVRFLSREAPILPLPGCDAATCNCKYRHYDDRREEPRRAADSGAFEIPYPGAERRRSGGRRSTDH